MADPKDGYYLEPGYAPDVPDPTGRWHEPGLAEIVRFEVGGGVPVPVNLTLPSISGTAQVAATLTRVNGTWSNSPTSFAHQWYANGVAISGATAATYVPVAGDVGKTITSTTIASNAGGPSQVATSAATSAVIAAAALAPTTASFTVGAASGSLIAAITGLSSGETASSVSPNDGRVALSSGSALVVGLTASSAGTISYTITTSAARTLTLAVTAQAAATTRRQNIASAMRAMGYETGSTSNGTDTAHNSVKWFVNESSVTVNAVQAILPGWWTDNDTNGVERDISGPLTVTGSIEYPAGTRVQMTFANGATSGTVAAGANYLSDMVTIPGGIPAGAFAAIHLFVTAASGVKWPVANAGNNFFGGRNDTSESGASGTLADKTMTGAPTTNSAGYHPIGVLADVPLSSAKKIVIAGVGDSKMAGATDGVYDASNNKGAYGRAATGLLPWACAAVTGTRAASSAANGMFTRRLDWLQKLGVTHCFLNYASNDLNVAGQTPATVSSNWNVTANLLNGVGIKAIHETVSPRQATASTQRWQTIASQTIDASGSFVAGSSSPRAVYNDTYVRAKPAPMFDYVEIADLFDVNSSNALTRSGGYWRVGTAPASGRYDQPYTGSVGSGATTTVIPTGVVKASNYFASFAGGRIVFTSGALSGTTAIISASDASGGITLTAALSSAPAQGDTFILYSDRVCSTNDGVHFGGFDPAATLGGVFLARDTILAKLNAYLAP